LENILTLIYLSSPFLNGAADDLTTLPQYGFTQRQCGHGNGAPFYKVFARDIGKIMVLIGVLSYEIRVDLLKTDF